MDYLLSFIVYYIGVGLLLNTGLTLYIYYAAYKQGLSVSVNWIGWLKLIPTWPKQLYKLIEGIFGR